MVVYVDIETLPPPIADPAMWARANYDPDALKGCVVSCQMTLKSLGIEPGDDALKKYRRLALDPMAGRILCIGFMVKTGGMVIGKGVCYHADHEERVLQVFLEALQGFNALKADWVAHNAEFDLGWIWKRALVHDMPKLAQAVPWMHHDFYSRAFCTMRAWRGRDTRARSSLDAIAKCLGLPGKVGMKGDQVWPNWLCGNHDRIAEYCKGDVVMLEAIHKRIVDI